MLILRTNGAVEELQEPEHMDKWEWQKYKRQVERDGTRVVSINDDDYETIKNKIKMKTSKVKAVQANGTWDSNYGTFYKFEYVMEDGQVVNANHKTQDGNFKVGEEVEYEITNSQYNNGKVSKPQEGFQGGTRTYTDNTKGIKIGHAITNAVSLYVALGGSGKDSKEAIKDFAKMIYQISEELNNEL